MSKPIRELNLELGRPDAAEALRRLAAEVEAARHLGTPAMKLIHGYGSSGRGGRLRTACRTWLRQQELCFLPGEEFTIFNEEARRWMAVCPRLRQDRDLDAENRGVTFVLLKNRISSGISCGGRLCVRRFFLPGAAGCATLRRNCTHGGPFMKRIASIQDISCLGRCSLTVALPVISAMAVECAIVPTAVLSTHTMFPGFISRDLSDQLLPIARHWKSQNVTLDAICTGYLASPLQTEEVCRFFDLLAGPDTLLFVDPAMADGGRLYAGFGPDFPGYMRRVVARAHVAVPNVTEACLLTGTPYRETEDLSWWRDLLRRVADLGPRYPVLTGVPFGPDRLGVLALDPDTGGFFDYHTPRVHDHFHGTGDIFSAACAGAMVRGKSLPEALRLAADFTLACIQATCRDPNAPWYGVEFEKALHLLPGLLEG